MVNPAGLAGVQVATGKLDPPKGADPKLWRKAKTFEAQFVATMLETGRNAAETASPKPFADGFAGDVWRSMRSKTMAGALVSGNDLGIAQDVYETLENGTHKAAQARVSVTG